ncbi:MAG: FAD/NAD(P)-binding protein [Candidatus Sericytochromatia bacterium]|nr:FAD/NAD(P)-binding protein [Candidatus Sericytochromatia bacterium]
MTHGPVIAIVGVGFSGAATAIQLLGRLAADAAGELHLIDRRPDLGRGVAYGTRDPLHLLNVPAAEMGLLPEAPDDLLRWLEAVGQPAEAEAFLPRGLYGDYVAASLEAAIAAAPPRLRVVRHVASAISCLPEGPCHVLRLATGAQLTADAVVLAWGLAPPASPAWTLPPGGQPPWLVASPWQPEALAPLPAGAEVLLLGTGLTAVDLALSLLARGAGVVHLVSRRGRLPAARGAGRTSHPAWLDPAAAPRRVSRLMRRIRAEVRTAAAAGHDWQVVMEALRPVVPALWGALPWVERRRFLRHARGPWEAHRQLLPPPTATRLQAAVQAGRISVRAGRVRALEAAADGARVHLRAAGAGDAVLSVARVVVCTGPDDNYRRVREPLAQALIGSGLARPDALRLGLDVAPGGQVLDEDGVPRRGLWAVGAMRKGALWESTAVRELRGQAAEVAAGLCRDLGLPVRGALRPGPARPDEAPRP